MPDTVSPDRDPEQHGAVPALDAIVPRSDFPLMGRVAYLNSAGMGLIPRSVQEAHDGFAREVATSGSLAFFEHLKAIKDAPRAAAARLFNANPADISIVTSTSEAINQIAWWLRPRAGQNIVAIDTESPAVTLPWIRVAEETGAKVRLVRASPEPAALSIEQVAALVDDRTAAISISHVQWGTGHRFDLKELAALAHAHGALLVVDAMQSAGVVPIDVQASDVDVLATGSFKWLCSFSGSGVCYVRPELGERLRPIFVGSLTLDPAPPWRETGVSQEDAVAGRRLEYASSAHTLRVALAAAIDYWLAVGPERVLRHVLGLTARIADGVGLLGGTVLTPPEDSRRAGILTAVFPGQDPDRLVSALEERQVAVCARVGGLRFAPHAFNNAFDVDRALAALEEILRR